VVAYWHPGWSGWFTWGGRRGRLSYIGAALLAGLALGAVVIALAALTGLGAQSEWRGLALVGVVGIGVAALAGVVAFVCILAQRLRDIGMPVIPCLVGYALASAVVSAGVATWGDPESAALWSVDNPLWLNLLQVAIAIFQVALLVVPGNAWLDEE
jgi:uncharacterized membrane protein YhaH (DUF805 family)